MAAAGGGFGFGAAAAMSAWVAAERSWMNESVHRFSYLARRQGQDSTWQGMCMPRGREIQEVPTGRIIVEAQLFIRISAHSL
jgi:hypothetical protein